MAINCIFCNVIKHIFTIFQTAMLIGIYTNAQDPCTTYLTINDVTMTTDYSQGPLDSLRYGDPIDYYKWYRYTGSPQGLLASSSPQGTQCLSENQVWSDDPIPGVDCKEEFINLCVKAKTEPCPLKGQTQAKNCGTYLVYQLIKLPGMARFCFEGNSTMSPKPTQKPCTSTSASPISTSLTSTLSTTTSTLASSSSMQSTSTSSTNITLGPTPAITTIKLASPLTSISTNGLTTSTTVKSTRTTSFVVNLTSTTRNHNVTRIATHSTGKTPTIIPLPSSGFTRLTLQTTRTSTTGSHTKGHTMVTKQTNNVSDRTIFNADSSQKVLNEDQNTAGLIAGIVVCTIVLICSSIFIVWKLFGRQIYTVSKSRSLETDPLKNAKPKFDVHRL